jgi:hypothetical protein
MWTRQFKRTGESDHTMSNSGSTEPLRGHADGKNMRWEEQLLYNFIIMLYNPIYITKIKVLHSPNKRANAEFLLATPDVNVSLYKYQQNRL